MRSASTAIFKSYAFLSAIFFFWFWAAYLSSSSSAFLSSAFYFASSFSYLSSSSIIFNFFRFFWSSLSTGAKYLFSSSSYFFFLFSSFLSCALSFFAFLRIAAWLGAQNYIDFTDLVSTPNLLVLSTIKIKFIKSKFSVVLI